MRKVAIGMLIVGGLALGGCNSDDDKLVYSAPKPLDKMSNEEWCAFYAKYITNPQISPKNKEIDLQRMKERGCATPG